MNSKDLNGSFYILDYERQMPLNYSTIGGGLQIGTNSTKQLWGLQNDTLVVMPEKTNTKFEFTQVSILSLEVHYEISLQSPEQNYF